MARKPRTAEELDLIAERLEKSARLVRETSAKMRKAKYADLLVHGDAPVNRYVPSVLKWALSLEVDFDDQRTADMSGQKSRALLDKERVAKRKAT